MTANLLKGLGIRTDVLVTGGRTIVEPHPLGATLRTPSEPDFWFGNRLVLSGTSQVDVAIEAFRAAFPQASHVTLSWDHPDKDLDQATADLKARGYEISREDALALAGPAQLAECPEGITLRPLESDGDWQAMQALQLQTGLETGHSEADYAGFLSARVAGWRRLSVLGQGNWYGAFDGDVLVADLGLYNDLEIGRFQSVETRASHRRRGICSALVSYALTSLRAAAPDALPVIVATTGGDAGRLYRRLGFEWVETETSALLRPKA